MASQMLRSSRENYSQEIKDKLKIIVVPYFVHNAIRANNLNIVDLATYSRIRKFLSLEDMGLWEMLNEGLYIGEANRRSYISTKPLFHVESLSPEESQEYSKFIRPLSGSKERVEASLASLSSSSELSATKLYEFVKTKDFIAVVVYKGFTTAMQDPASKKTFVGNYLEYCNNLVTENQVAELEMFREYLALLSN